LAAARIDVAQQRDGVPPGERLTAALKPLWGAAVHGTIRNVPAIEIQE